MGMKDELGEIPDPPPKPVWPNPIANPPLSPTPAQRAAYNTAKAIYDREFAKAKQQDAAYQAWARVYLGRHTKAKNAMLQKQQQGQVVDPQMDEIQRRLQLQKEKERKQEEERLRRLNEQDRNSQALINPARAALLSQAATLPEYL